MTSWSQIPVTRLQMIQPHVKVTRTETLILFEQIGGISDGHKTAICLADFLVPGLVKPLQTPNWIAGPLVDKVRLVGAAPAVKKEFGKLSIGSVRSALLEGSLSVKGQAFERRYVT